MNSGTPLLQCQVPTWLRECEAVRPNDTSARVYASNQQKQSESIHMLSERMPVNLLSFHTNK